MKLKNDFLLEGEPEGNDGAPAALPVPSPAAPPEPSPAPGLAQPESSPEIDFEELLKDDDEEALPEPTAEPESPPALAVPPVAPTPIPSAVSSPTPEPTPAVEPQATPTPADPAVAQREREERARTFRTNLSKMYLERIPEEQRNQFLPEQVQMLASLAAEQHVNLLESVVPAIMMQLPQVFEGIMQQREMVRQREQTFYGAWPKLKGHEGTVTKILSAYLNGNPQVKFEDAVREVGAMAMVATRQTVDSPAPQAPTPSAFSPAVPQSGSGTLPRPTQKTTWDEMVEDFIQEDMS